MDLKLKFLIGLGASFIVSIFLAITLNNVVGWTIMGICMFGFLFYALGLTFTLMTPVQFFEILFEKAGDDFKQPKFYGHLFVGAMVVIGIGFVVVSTYVWFRYYIFM